MSGSAMGCDQLRAGPQGTVSTVIDGDSFFMESGARVRLIGVQAPKKAQGREMEDWPLADEAEVFLSDLVADQTVTLKYAEAEKDRYGRLLVHAFVGEDEVWVQKALIAAGLARVYSLADNRLCLEDLLAAERVARADRMGIWADPYYALRSAGNVEALAALSGRFELVEGVVKSVGLASGRAYLNFGSDYDRDFTAMIDPSGVKLFAASDLDPEALAGALVRVRGWVEEYGGPRIVVTHPEQIEVLAR